MTRKFLRPGRVSLFLARLSSATLGTGVQALAGDHPRRVRATARDAGAAVRGAASAAGKLYTDPSRDDSGEYPRRRGVFAARDVRRSDDGALRTALSAAHVHRACGRLRSRL